jgi:peptide/nickel transport system permease protein
MGAYIVRRLLWTVLLLFVITAVTFVIFYVMPSADPAKLRAGRSPTPETLVAIRHQLGLDKSLPGQYVHYVDRVFLHFDLGRSYATDLPVKQTIFDRLPNTAFLVLGAAIIWFTAGVLIGIVSAVRRGSFWDRLLMGGALFAISGPPYWFGLVALYLFSTDIGVLHIFPGSGSYQDANGFFAKIPTLIMPWIILSMAFAAIYARLLRANLLETMSEDYIRTARAKGLPERTVIFRHGVRSAITPVVTVLGLDIGILMGGAIFTESVFNIDGIGRLAFDAIQRGDLQTIQGTVLVLALGVALMSLLVDILYAFLDPRVRY